jgi:hypothetical protein
MYLRFCAIAILCSLASLAVAQDTDQKTEQDKRAFGVLPNNRTADGSLPFEPITAKRKMTIAFKDSFDGPIYFTSAAFAGIYQWENQNPSFGQGMAGYAKRYATSLSDLIVGNMMSEGVIPALGHQDPRYFRVGQGSGTARVWNAVKSIFVAPMDSGRKTFNFSEWGGNAVSVALSNTYYPDTRNVHDNVGKLLMQCGTDALSNVLKEFWPDVKRRLQRKNNISKQP